MICKTKSKKAVISQTPTIEDDFPLYKKIAEEIIEQRLGLAVTSKRVTFLAKALYETNNH